MPADTVCLSRHSYKRLLSSKKGTVRGAGARFLGAFKRPAAAVWGNGLWGSVGAAGRSYD